MMNTDNRLLTRESSEYIREFFHRRTSPVSMSVSFAGRSPAMAARTSIRTANWLEPA